MLASDALLRKSNLTTHVTIVRKLALLGTLLTLIDPYSFYLHFLQLVRWTHALALGVFLFSIDAGSASLPKSNCSFPSNKRSTEPCKAQWDMPNAQKSDGKFIQLTVSKPAVENRAFRTRGATRDRHGTRHEAGALFMIIK